MSRSRTRKRVPYRCNDCRRRAKKATGKDISARFTLKDAACEPVCPVCGSTNVRSIKAIRERQRAAEGICRCSGLPYRHRPGSHKLCHHYEGQLTEEEERDAYYDMMAADRTSWE